MSPVSSRFRQTGERSYRVVFPDGFDRRLPLVVDPSLVFSSYWGSGKGNNRTVSTDSSGNIYMSGGTVTPSWPTTAGAYDTRHSGTKWPDVHAAKFNAQGHVIWSTLMGGPSRGLYVRLGGRQRRAALHLGTRRRGLPDHARGL